MFHRFIAVLLIAVSLFLHAAPVAMAAQGALPAVPLVGVNGEINPNAKAGDFFSNTNKVFVPSGTTTAVFSGGGIAPQIGPPAPGEIGISYTPSDLVPQLTGTEGLWDLPDFDKFFADNPYLSQLICMTPGFISDLLNIAAGIFGVLGPFLGILGVFVSDPSNTITNIQQLMTMTQQLKSMFEQCKNQKRINSVLGTTAPPVDLVRFIAATLGRYGETSSQADVRRDNPQWFGDVSLNSPQGVLNTGLEGLRTARLFTGVVGEITGDQGFREFAQNLANAEAVIASLHNLFSGSLNLFTNVFTNIGRGGNPVTQAQQLAGTFVSIFGGSNDDDCSAIEDEYDREGCFDAQGEDAFNAANDAINYGRLASSDTNNSGKTKNFKDKNLSAVAGVTGATTVDTTYETIVRLLTGRYSNEPPAKCQTDVTEYRLNAARNCALKCAAASVNYVSNNAIKVQQLVANSGECIVAGQTLPKQFCPTLTEVVANSGSVRGDIQSLVAIEFYGLTGELARGEVTALCSACEGIKALIGTPTECR